MRPANIPKWADAFLRWYCRADLIEEIQGDLYELFKITRQESNLKTARRQFTWNVMRSFRRSTIRKPSPNINNMPIKSHFKVAIRLLWKQKSYTIINTLSLALGFACCVFISIYILNEFSYDTKHPNNDRLYRLLSRYVWDGEESRGIYHNPPLAELLKDNLPEIENAFRVRTTDSRLVKTGEGAQNSYEQFLIYADQELLEMFHLPLKYGDPSNALEEPFTVVLTEDKAEKYFGKINPLGQSIYLNNQMDQPYRVTGVIAQTKVPSHLQYDFYLSMEGLKESQSGSWRRSSYPTYLLLENGAVQEELEDKMRGLVSQYKEDILEDGIYYELQPVKDIYLNSADVQQYGHWPIGDQYYIGLFGTIALVILFVAVINYVNLSTARSANRSAEVGIRKIVGSNQFHLKGQFLVESIVQSLVAILVSLGLVRLVEPFVGEMFGAEFSVPWQEATFVGSILGAGIVVGILAGLYPAFYIARFPPLRSIQAQSNHRAKGRLRWALVTAQFATSFILIFSTLLVYRQMQYIQSKKLGFDRERVLILEDTYSLNQQINAFKSQLQQLSSISSVTMSSYLPVDGYLLNGSTFQHPDSVDGSQEVELRRWFIDEDYLPTLNMHLTKGRNFTADLSLDTNSMILNETAVKMLGFDNPIGHPLKINQRIFEIVGVVEDFHFRSMKQPIVALAFHRGDPSNMTSTIVKAKSDNFEDLIAQVQTVWKSFLPDQPLRYHFLDERFDQMYSFEQKVSSTFAIFSTVAIFIASLGLFALTAFMAENRRKELSIRKVLGASIANLFQLQTQLFGRLLLVAISIGIPIAYFGMQNWLQDFAYRTNITWDIFLLSILLTFFLIAFTVSFQALKLAKANPVEALQGE